VREPSASRNNGASGATTARPRLLLFHSSVSGRCRRVDGFLAQVLQRRANHATFELERIEAEERPDVHESFGIDEVPTLVVVEHGKIRGRVVDPSGCKAIERFLAPWLR
jgi:thioredoxin-like negative regulator of GroEL